jgi:hypothetical protein
MRVLSHHRRMPRGASAAPKQEEIQALTDLIGKEVEIFLQGDPLTQDELETGYLSYVSAGWIGFVTSYRAQRFFDHIPITSIRKVRGSILHLRKPLVNPFEKFDFDNCPHITDLIGKIVICYLQGHQLLRDAAFNARLLYVKKSWIGTAATFSKRLLLDHIPIASVRKITTVALLPKAGRFI